MKDRRQPSLRELLNGGDLIRPDELARGLKVATSTVYSWVERGTIPHLRLGKSVRFDPEELKLWLERAARRTATCTPSPRPSDYPSSSGEKCVD